jgi:hypothetical protein
MSKLILKNLKNAIAVIFLLTLFGAAGKAGELTVEDIISRHLDSIGTKDNLARVVNRMALGTSLFESKLPNRKTGGKVVIVSEGGNLFFVASFNTENYPFEKIGFFSGKVVIPFVVLGVRSPLGVFINDHNKSLSEGLFTGSMSTMWNLLNPERKGKFGLAGKKKVNKRNAYVLDYYEPGSSASFTIKLFFDAETFQHVRTEYRDVITPKEATFGVLGQESGVTTVLTEDFGDFKDTDGLTLPHLYKISYMTESNAGVYEYNWKFMISQYTFNKKYTPDFFNF